MTVSVRPATAADAAAIAAIYGGYVEHGYATFELDPPGADEFQRRMLARPRLPWLVAEQDGLVIGFAYAVRYKVRPAYRWTAEVSVYLAADAPRREGVGRSLYDRLLPAVARLGYYTVVAGIALPNPASVALHESLGFSLVGTYRDIGFKLGRWRDVGTYQLRLREAPAGEPEEPLEWEPPE